MYELFFFYMFIYLCILDDKDEAKKYHKEIFKHLSIDKRM